MIPEPTIKRIYNGTCAVGIMTADSIDSLIDARTIDGFKIAGTGFLVRSDVMLTNAHVAIAMDAFVKQHNLKGQRMAAQFNYFSGGRMEQAYCPLKRCCVLQQPVRDDIALCAFDRHPDDPTGFTDSVKRLSIVESVEEVRLGEAIGIVGFPYGERLHVDERSDQAKIVRLGPILQHGYISACQPWERTIGLKEILLDARTIHGMSGSPVFRQETGQVIGVIWGGHVEDNVPHFVFSRAVPVDWIRVSTWLGMLDNAKGEFVQADVKY